MTYFPVDITTYHRGFHGDLNETFFVGDVDEKSKKLVRVTHECLAKAINLGTPRTNHMHSVNITGPNDASSSGLFRIKF